MLRTGQQSTFPKIQFIKNRLKIEYAILEGLHRFSADGQGASATSIRPFPLEDGAAGADQKNNDPREERLNRNFPERSSEYSYDYGKGFSDFSDDPIVSAENSSVDDNYIVPSRHRDAGAEAGVGTGTAERRGSFSSLFNLEEMRRQSAVFFDDPDLYRDGGDL